MRISNAKVRRRLIKYARLFLSQNCQYDDGHENAGVEVMLDRLYSVDPACEQMNKRLPNHGKKLKDAKVNE